jgi:hypothetical protein
MLFTMKYVITISVLFAFCLNLSAQTIVYVNTLASGNNDGTSWQNAYIDLQSALNSSIVDAEIWIAKGTYKPTAGTNRNQSFGLFGKKQLYGGFSGVETNRNQRNWESNPVILSGDIGIADNSSDNSYNVVSAFGVDSSLLLDGLVIRDGNYSITNAAGGGGLFITGNSSVSNSKPIIRNCKFIENRSSGTGGAINILCIGGTSTSGVVTPIFMNCIFDRNQSRNGGGAIYRKGPMNPDDTLRFINCSFINNRCTEYLGGAIFIQDPQSSGLLIKNCLFEKDTALEGGAIAYLTSDTYKTKNLFVIDSSKFNLNRSFFGASVISSYGVPINLKNSEMNFSVTNSTFTNNSVRSEGECIGFSFYNEFKLSMSFNTCIFENNKSIGAPIIRGWSVEGGNLFVDIDKCKFIDNSGANPNGSQLVLSFLSGTTQDVIDTAYSNINIKNSLFANNAGGMYIGVAIRGFGETYIENCTFFDHNGYVFNKSFFEEWLSPSNVKKMGNWMYLNNCVIWEPDTDFRDLFYNNDPDTQTGYMFSLKNSMATISTVGIQLLDGIEVDSSVIYNVYPEFMDTLSYDFRLQPCSPLINKGSNALTTTTTDIAGNPRIQRGIVDIGAYEAPPATLSAIPVAQPSCPDTAVGRVDFVLQNACAPYQYRWVGPNGSSGTSTNLLSPGDYQFSIIDNRGDTVSTSVTIPVSAPPALTPVTMPVICGSTVGGSATFEATGTGPYSFLWAGGSTDSLRTNLPPGAYEVIVRDRVGCATTGTANITTTGSLSIEIEQEPVSCFGGSDGALNVSPANGLAPFSYQWANGSTTSEITDVPAGSYAGTLTDAFGCRIVWILPINEPSALQLAADIVFSSDSMEADGSIALTPSGGTAPYTVLWNTEDAIWSLGSLTHGVYTVTITDANGCTLDTTFIVGVTNSTNDLLSDPRIQIYPNPVMRDQFSVQVPAELGAYDLIVQDALGRQIWRNDDQLNGESIIPIKNWARGWYLVTIRTKQGQKSLRLMRM